MPKHPRLRGKQVVVALQHAGFIVKRVRGSHYFLQHTDGRATVVPVHSGETVGPGLFNRILRDCELTNAEFLKLL
jgi:predicted RNA binding protein YcfA (HicA-like mRNA interferase family)